MSSKIDSGGYSFIKEFAEFDTSMFEVLESPQMEDSILVCASKCTMRPSCVTISFNPSNSVCVLFATKSQMVKFLQIT